MWFGRGRWALAWLSGARETQKCAWKENGKTLGFLPLWDPLMGPLLPLSLENMAVR